MQQLLLHEAEGQLRRKLQLEMAKPTCSELQ